MKMQAKTCKYCGREIYDIGNGVEGHWWGCREVETKIVLEKMAEKLQALLDHLGVD